MPASADAQGPPAPFPSLRRVHVPAAGAGLALIMQSGVELHCMTGIPFSVLLKDEIGIPPVELAKIDVFLLDGKPVDEPDGTPVRAGSRIALAAGLPGIAGLAMKSGSAVRALRPGITHGAAGSGDTGDPRDASAMPGTPGPGIIEAALFRLALPLLAPRFLERGVVLAKEKLLAHARPAIAGLWLLDGRPLDCAGFAAELAALPGATPLFLTARPA